MVCSGVSNLCSHVLHLLHSLLATFMVASVVLLQLCAMMNSFMLLMSLYSCIHIVATLLVFKCHNFGLPWCCIFVHMSTLVALVYKGIIIAFGTLAMMCYDVLTYGNQDLLSDVKAALKKLYIYCCYHMSLIHLLVYCNLGG